WEHDWSDRFGHVVAVNFSNEDYIDSVQSREDKIQQYDIGVQYLLRRGIILGADYTFKDRSSNIINHDYVNNIFMFSAKVGL
ncbi:MAG: outer membrane beta-barrel protein, partial [Pseudomonadota bacterium]